MRVLILAAAAAACAGSGDTAAGGACHTATDCLPGLYCYPLTSSAGGTCTANADKAQPPQDGGFPDGGLAPMLDALPADDGSNPPVTDSATDAGMIPEATAPPPDTGTSPETSTP